MATTEELAKDEHIKNFLKRFFKQNTNFKEVPGRKGCDALLLFDKKNLQNFTIFLNDDLNKDIAEAVESGLLNIIFLKIPIHVIVKKQLTGLLNTQNQVKIIADNYTQ